MTPTRTTETLASRNWTGEYGFTFQSRFVRRGDKHYIIHDHWCGMDSIEGAAPREFVYAVPTEQVERVKNLYEHASKESDIYTSETYLTRWDDFILDVLPSLVSYGRASRLRWARDL